MILWPHRGGCRGHTLATVLEEAQALTGVTAKRIYVDKGYQGHNAPNPFRVYLSGQRRGVHGAIKRELRRHTAFEPVIGHMNSEGHLGRNYFNGRHGDRPNAILRAVGHNLRLVLRWLRTCLRQILAAFLAGCGPKSALNPAS